MSKYTVILSQAEEKALSFIAVDPNEWIQNAVHDRCRVAIDEIVSAEVQRLLSEGKPITGSRDDIVISAQIETAAARHSRFLEELNSLQEQQG